MRNKPTRREYERMGATCRRRVGGGPGPLVPRWLRANLSPEAAGSTLDFGCGVDAVQVEELRGEGYEVVGYEWAPEEGDTSPRAQKFREAAEAGLLDPEALAGRYATVLASNVLNVQPSESALRGTLRQLQEALAEGGSLVANLASEPRPWLAKGAKGRDQLEAFLREHFGAVELLPVPGSKEKVFLCSEPRS